MVPQGVREQAADSGSAEPSVALGEAANGVVIVPDTKQKVFYF